MDKSKTKAPINSKLVHLFWTGGWDSTFRLLYLLLVQNKQIQPYYIIDSDRPSTGIELRTMKHIKKRLFDRYPRSNDLLRPTRFRERSDIKPNADIIDSFNRLCSRCHLGPQWSWLAQYANEAELDGLELCAHRDGSIYRLIHPVGISSGSADNSANRIGIGMLGTDEYIVFKYFSFPLLDMTKLDMQLISKKERFYDLMELTWFCHRPRSNNKPCGICTPCSIVLKEGLGKRMPMNSRLRHYIHKFNYPRQILLDHPRVFAFVRKMKGTRKCL